MRALNVMLVLLLLYTAGVRGAELSAVQIYSDNQLLSLIKENKHLAQVVLDDCQLLQDIEARAEKAKMPSYQFLWGDMLAYGICTKKDVELGFYYMKLAADQGLAEGLEQLGRYYHLGKFVQVDINMAIRYLKAASSLNNLKAQLRLAEIYNQGLGSPLDYPILYSQLFHAISDDKQEHKKITELLLQLAIKLPEHVVNAAKKTVY